MNILILVCHNQLMEIVSSVSMVTINSCYYIYFRCFTITSEYTPELEKNVFRINEIYFEALQHKIVKN